MHDFESSNFIDPFDRLENLEQQVQALLGLAETFRRQLTNTDSLLVQVSETMQQLAAMNISLNQQNQSLHHRLKILEHGKNYESTTPNAS